MLSENSIFTLDEMDFSACPCQERVSKENGLGWIHWLPARDQLHYAIGVAHGA